MYVVAGLAGVTGGEFGPKVIEKIRQSGAEAIFFGILPFETEGHHRAKREQVNLNSYLNVANQA